MDSSTLYNDLNNCLFGKIKDLQKFLDPEDIYNFINKTCKKNEKYSFPIHEISNVYLLLSELNPKVILGYVWISKSENKKVIFINWMDTFIRGFNFSNLMIKKLYEIYNPKNRADYRSKSKIEAVIPKTITESNVDYWINKTDFIDEELHRYYYVINSMKESVYGFITEKDIEEVVFWFLLKIKLITKVKLQTKENLLSKVNWKVLIERLTNKLTDKAYKKLKEYLTCKDRKEKKKAYKYLCDDVWVTDSEYDSEETVKRMCRKYEELNKSFDEAFKEKADSA